MNTLFILSNSPGEVSGWMGPVTGALADRDLKLSITGVTLPCPYASGMEAASACLMAGVSDVVRLREAMRSVPADGKRLILQLGGDPMYGCALSLKLRAPWMIYTARPRWRGRVRHYFIPDEFAKRRFEEAGVTAEQRSLVGNLILDSVPELGNCRAQEFRSRYGVSAEHIVCFMAGSRPFEYELGFAFYSECARILHRKYPQWQAVFPVAPTVDEERLCVGLKKAGLEWRGGEHAEEILLDDGYRVPLVRSGQYDAIAAASLSVAFPGTNNLQIASLGVPLLMIAPLNQAENIPLDGLAGALSPTTPGLRTLKKRLVFWYNAKEDYLSLPNRLAGSLVLPERREIMTPESASFYISELIESPDKRREIAEGYSKLDLRRGAAAKIAGKIEEFWLYSRFR